MDDLSLKSLYKSYKDFLLNKCIPFWQDNSPDHKFGGFLTCLDRTGKIYNTDKSVWFQGRGLWTFSRLYNEIEKREEWLTSAKSGFDFLTKHCFDNDGRMFFQVTRDGQPIRKRRYYYSETFAVVGCAEYAKASGDSYALQKAREVYGLIIDLYKNPWKVPSKFYETKLMKSLSIPMIILVTTQCMRDLENSPVYNDMIEKLMEEIFKDFMKPEYSALFENVGLKGERLDSPQGRCINPGHAIETAWFLMNEGIYRNDSTIVKNALNILDWSMNLGWDKEYGGLLSFIDIEGKPCEQLEWDMKLWWPHTEALHALLLAYHITGDVKYKKQHDMVYVWSFGHFADEQYGEWYGYLHRNGGIANTLKGSMWKGPFHLPRALILNTKLLEKMMNSSKGIF